MPLVLHRAPGHRVCTAELEPLESWNSSLIRRSQMVANLDAVVNVSMHSEGRYAFVELRTPEMATAALQLSGQVGASGSAALTGPACRMRCFAHCTVFISRLTHLIVKASQCCQSCACIGARL